MSDIVQLPSSVENGGGDPPVFILVGNGEMVESFVPLAGLFGHLDLAAGVLNRLTMRAQILIVVSKRA